MPLRDDDIDGATSSEPRPKGKLPYLPDREATMPTLRRWLSKAIGLPPEVRVDTVHRHGRDEDDAISILLSNGSKLRCNRQKRLLTPHSFAAFFSSESDGVCQPHYLSRAEVIDVYQALCRLGTAEATISEVDDLEDRLSQFVILTEPVMMSLARDRYATIEHLRGRIPYDPKARPPTPPVCLVDTFDHLKRYIRANEWVSYLRVVHGQAIVESRLESLMRELKSPKHSLQGWNVDRSHHNQLVFYELPASA